MFSCIASTSRPTFRLYCSTCGFRGGAAAPGFASCRRGAAVSDTVMIAVATALVDTRDTRISNLRRTIALEGNPRADPHDPRRDDVQWAQERRTRAPAQVLLRIRVEQIEGVEDAGQLDALGERKHLLRADVEDSDVVLPPRAERFGQHTHGRIVELAGLRDERAAVRLSGLVAQDRRHPNCQRRLVGAVEFGGP